MIGLLRRLRARLRYRRFDDDLSEEMAFHQAMKQQELEQNGLSTADARGAARREMGNITRAREDSRGVWIASWLESIWQDIVYAVRNLRRQPAFTLAAFAALLLGIGLNTSAFTLFNAVALRPWPVEDPGRVVRIYNRGPGPNGRRQGVGGFGLAEYRYLREHTRTFTGLIATRQSTARLGHEDVGQSTGFEYVSHNYFDTLGVELILGRGFLRDEDVPASPTAVAVISHRLWTRVLSSDPNVLGRTLPIEDVPFTIVGVASPDFTGTTDSAQDLWLPLSALRLLQPDQAYARSVLEKPDYCCSQIAGRLAPAVTREQARAELNVLSNQYHAQWKLEESGVVFSSTAFFSHPNSQRKMLPMIGLMSVAVVLVLLLACANVGNLLLARGMARRREIAIRLSLGASRARVVRQLMTEGLVLAVIAGAAAIGVAYVLPAFFFRQVSSADLGYSIEPDVTTLAFTAGASLLACLLFALAPALRVTSTRAKKGAGTGAASYVTAATQPGRDLASRAGASGTGLRGMLLATQLGLSIMLLAGAGLLLRSVHYAQRHDPGFRIDDVMVASPLLPRQAYDEKRGEAFIENLASTLREDSGLRVGSTALVPLGNATGWTDFRFPGQDKSRARQIRTQDVSTDYFDVLGIPLVAGRVFGPADGRQVVLINEAMARQYFAGENPVGRTLVMGQDKDWQIIGIVRDAYVSGLDRVHPLVFGQNVGRGARLVIRSDANAGDIAARVKAVATRLDSRVQIDAKPLATYRDRWLAPARVMATTAGIVSLLALALASVGVFGVFAFVVQERTREIGIRMAIGARAGQVVRLVLRSTSWATAAGLVLGLAGSVLVSRALDGFTDGIARFDVMAYGGVAAILAVAALVATYVPVRRATRVDPATALRCE
jgi:macrolide transport system ATP-binding/permease protein